MSGAVEVLKSRDAAASGSEASSMACSASVERSFTIDIDESLTLECANLHGGALAAPAGAVNGRLHIDRSKARARGASAGARMQAVSAVGEAGLRLTAAP
jgi:hypothetical protein